ncbi:MAG: peptide chain release factor 3, partial [Bacteroidetes bacterium]
DEIEQKLHLKVRPLSWPIGMGYNFKGVYNLYEKKLFLYSNKDKQTREEPKEINVNSTELEKYLGDSTETLREDLELIETVYPEFDRAKYINSEIVPVFFGSALNNFGVQELLDCFLDIAPSPLPRQTEQREVSPYEEKFSGFVFKIHANMDPKHRDRLAFVKICSGVFKRNTNYLHTRLGKNFKFSSPTAFMAQKKSVIEEAYPGDIVGIHDTGNFKIGDTITEGEQLEFKGMPSFSPEIFKYIENADPMKSKQLAKGIDQLMDEGVAQLFTRSFNGRKIIGTVGALQFEVIEYRLKHEYGATSRFESGDFHKACWLTGDEDELNDFKKKKYRAVATDKQGRDVYLAESAYSLQMAQQNYPKLQFHFKSEF